MVLVVDEVKENLRTFQEILEAEHEVVTKENGLEAIDFLFNTKRLPQAILLNTDMHGVDGFQIMGIILGSDRLKKIPIIATTDGQSELQALAAGAADYIQQPFYPMSVKLRVNNQIMLNRHLCFLENSLNNQISKTNQLRDRMLESMADIIEYRNLESGQHVKRTTELFRVLVREMAMEGVYPKEVMEINSEEVFRLVALHDVGKISIPDNILLKPGKLTEQEFEVIKQHTVIGREIIETIFENLDEHEEYICHCKDITYFHHERFEGSGYPLGLVGYDIPLSARVMAVVDVYDAVVNKRIYKEACPQEEALNILKEGAGIHFDPLVVLSALKLAKEFNRIESKLNEYIA